MQSFFYDLRFGLRTLRGSPGFTAVAVLTLALGIAAATTVFGWIEGVLLNPFPGVAQPRDLYLLETVTTDGTNLVNFSFRDYQDYRDQLRLAEGVAASRFTPTYLGPQGRSERIFVELVTRNYFEVLGVPMVLGEDPERGMQRPGGGLRLGGDQRPVLAVQVWRGSGDRRPPAPAEPARSSTSPGLRRRGCRRPQRAGVRCLGATELGAGIRDGQRHTPFRGRAT